MPASPRSPHVQHVIAAAGVLLVLLSGLSPGSTDAPGRASASHTADADLPRVPRSGSGAPTPSWSRSLQKAVNRLPDTRARSVRWVVTDKYGSWGTADWYRNTVYVSPRVPEARLYDVAAHEWAHLLSTYPYRRDVDDAVAAMNRYFGGSGLTGAERAADCMARAQRATWTSYTRCESTHWRRGAARLLEGRPL